MNELSLALRNLMRNRRRSLTTLLAVMVGAMSILLFGGYVRYVVYSIETRYVRQLGHLQIQHADYFHYGSGNPAAYGIADYSRVIELLKADPVLKPKLFALSPILQFGGIAGNFQAGVSRTVIGRGMVVSDQNRMRLWDDDDFAYIDPELALTHAGPDAAVIGTGLARVLELCTPLNVADCVHRKVSMDDASSINVPNDIAALSSQERPARNDNPTRIELLAPSPRGAPNVVQLNVVKAEQQGVKEWDDIYLAMHLEQAQRLIYGKSEPQVTAIVVQLKHTADMQAMQARIEGLLHAQFGSQPLTVLDFVALDPFFTQTINMFNVIFGFVSILIGAIVLFMLGNTMSMAVVERTVEIGTLRSIGLKRADIRRLFVYEGMLLGLIGSVLGVMGAVLISGAVNHSGLTWIPPGRTLPVPLSVRVWGEIPLIAVTVTILLLLATLSAWWPARRAAQLNIVEALRHV